MKPWRWQNRGRRHPLLELAPAPASSAASSGPFRLLTKSGTCNQQERGRCCFHGSSGSSLRPQWREAPGCPLFGSSGARRWCPCGHTVPGLPCTTNVMAESPSQGPRGPSEAPTALRGRELGRTRDLLRQRCLLRRDLYKEPPDRAALATPGVGAEQEVWGHQRGVGTSEGSGWGRRKQPNTVWDGHMPALLTRTELFRPATAGSQLPHACPKQAAMNPESTQENAKNCPQNAWGKQLIPCRQRLRFPQSPAEEGDPQGCSYGSNGQGSLSLERRGTPRLCLRAAPAFLPPEKPTSSSQPCPVPCPASPAGLGRGGRAPVRLLRSAAPVGRQALHHPGQDTRAGGQPAGRSPATEQREPQARLGALLTVYLRLFW